MEKDGASSSERLKEFFAEYGDSVHAYATSLVGPSAAADVVAETFLVAWRRIEDVPDEPVAWLLGTARKVARTHVRGQARQARLVERMHRMRPAEVLDSAEDALVGDSEVLARLRRLPFQDRQVLVLSAWFDLSASQAASVLGCSVTAYSVRLHRARRRFRRELDVRGNSLNRSTSQPHREVQR